MDYLYGGVRVTNATVTVTPGTMIGAFGLDTFTNSLPYSLDAEGGGAFSDQGLANAPNRIAQYNTVQEGPSPTSWASPDLSPLMISDFEQSSPAAAVFNFRFTDFSCLAQDDYLWAFDRNGQLLIPNSGPVNFRDCEFYSGWAYSESVNITNCLFDRVKTDFEPYAGQFSWVYNNLIYGGSFTVNSTNNSATNAALFNNLFDLPVPADVSLPSWQPANGGYNAYYWPSYTNTYFLNAILLTNAPVFQSGPLGSFYQLTNPFTIYAGNTNANLLGFYHYTVMTNELIDGTNYVSIGYHYVATTNGVPLDSNGDGIPNYLEDANGNGVVDSGEIGWNIVGDPGLTVIITQPRNGSMLP